MGEPPLGARRLTMTADRICRQRCLVDLLPLVEFLLGSRFMLTPNPTRWAARWVCSATAASVFVYFVQPTFAKTNAHERSGKGRAELFAGAPAPAPPPLLFVAGPNKAVRFRIDLAAGTLATPGDARLLEGIVDVALAERRVFLCQASSAPGAPARVVAFDLHSGKRTEAALAEARAASAQFCVGRLAQTARAVDWGLTRSSYFTALQMSLERQATILPSVSNGEEQFSFLISSRHSLSSLTTTPPGQS